ncbi:unnamed protein product [Kuraishia capsulata CBS 1993]|uniref:Methyltransferase type 11 domain-containing protein n=1 Tax=Kuraishia capsulata CBS 1993 TaxID=1382522 RepID=W6MHZ5_9ASCO|nr:uncharacterized protein KUCA_T00001433001 [Kuraishia capsulata CBS 1993]CDK25463.1 unnamed protein product [Kuraishia capsulata CBS 1993]
MSLQDFHNITDPREQEKEYVHEVYDEIASHFSQTRYKPWPIVDSFLKSRPDHSIGSDVGCGNGKYIGLNPKLTIFGSDFSGELIRFAEQRCLASDDVLVSDGLNLPHEDSRFDFVISIAVVHHFSTPDRRVEAVRELLRVLRTGGEVLIYCWALEQASSRRGWTDGMEQDVLVPWVTRVDGEEVTKHRYYHLYREGELVKDVGLAGGEVVDHGYERDNWWVIAQKK